MNSRSNGSSHRQLNAGETLLTLNVYDAHGDKHGEELILRPTSRAWSTISRRFEGLAKARQAILDENTDAIVFIIRVGGGLNDRDARNLEDRIWKSGLDIDLLLPLLKYIAILNNGGRPLPDEVEGVFENMESASQQSIENYSSEKND